MSGVKRQQELYKKIKTSGGEKHDKNSLRLSQMGGFAETSSGKRFSNQAIGGFYDSFNMYIEAQLNQIRKSGLFTSLVSENGEELRLELDPFQIGRIIIRSFLRSIVRPQDRRISLTGVAVDIGDNVEFAIKEVLIDQDPKHKKKKEKLMDMLRRQEKLGDEEEIRKVVNDLSERVNIDHENWSKSKKISVGYALLDILLKSEVNPDFSEENLMFFDLFVEYQETKFSKGSLKKMKHLTLSDLGVLWMDDNDQFIRDLTLSFLPMVVEPQDWTIDHGGYEDQTIYDTYTLIKRYKRKKIKKLYEKYPQGFNFLINTINTLQKTPFRVNRTVWEAVNWIHTGEKNLDRKGIPTYTGGWDKFIGEDKAKEFFAMKPILTRHEDGKLKPESKKILVKFAKEVISGSEKMNEKSLMKEWADLRKSVIKHACSERSKVLLLDYTLRDSEEFLDEDKIYFCYNADYRGRIYPLAGQFSPQGSDVSRGMLEFANGVKVDAFEDEDAVRQIAIVCANNFGEDKISLDDRAQWSEDHAFEMMECARNFKENQWWTEADKPFLFLQSCIEWTKLMDARFNDEDNSFISTLPIAFDGSCNGIQHYSALFLDPKGAEAVNLVKSEVPSDVYQEVANESLKIAKDSKRAIDKLLVELNDQLEGKLFGRKVAKRSVMTLPYGVSKRSSNVYVVEEVNNLIRNVSLSDKERRGIRNRMGNLIWDAILLVVEMPVTGKKYFQAVAREVADWEKGLLWLTPTGFPVLQDLKKRDVKSNLVKVTTNGNTRYVKYPRYTSEIDGGEQANAIAPNFVHSFDSAHLQFSITAAAKEKMDNFLVIHDSFSTDALNAGRFNHIIREQFVKMYSRRDYINRFHNDCQEQLGVELTTTKEKRGDFDILEVLESEYFFA